eukprot:TRINITY_DN2253_c0_g1_i1.p1 TRINITY_DN2253_c0_g1~~TRINITY_DN2253_c0_g1_i1.p1  ORF type:complete len:696 (-),score=127.92 TRINITY_DN2253_c0_g1_i1:24-2111(-)
MPRNSVMYMKGFDENGDEVPEQSAASLRDSLFHTGVYQSYVAIPQDEPADGNEEGERPMSWLHDCLFPDVESNNFSIVIGCVIVVNAIVLGLETDLGAKHFVVFEHVFNTFFTYEMILRLSQNGITGYFMKFSNTFDCLLVCTGDFDLWISPLLMSQQGGETPSDNKGSAKLLKLLRMFRVMRIVRLFKMFRQLQIILEAFMKALSTVMWVGLLTIILNYVCAVFLTQTIGQNAAMWEDKEHKIQLWFGTIGRSIRTLFIVITLAEWDEIALTVADQVNGMIVFTLAMAYITITAFTMVSLITGIISEELVRAQNDERERKAMLIDRGRCKLADDVEETLKVFDDDNSGTLSPDEVLNALHSPELKLTEKLALLQIELTEQDLQAIIEKLKCAIGSPEVCIGDLADALKQSAGVASAAKLWDLKMIILQMRVQLKDGMNKVYKRLDAIESSHRGANPTVQAGSILSTEILTDIYKRLNVLEEVHGHKMVNRKSQDADLLGLPRTGSFDELDEFSPFRDTRTIRRPQQLSMDSASQQLLENDGISCEAELKSEGTDLAAASPSALAMAHTCDAATGSQRCGDATAHDIRLGSFESRPAFESLERIVGESSQRLENLRSRLETTEAEVRSSSAQTNAMFQEMMNRMSQVLDRSEECSKLGVTMQRMAEVIDRNESFHAELLALLRLGCRRPVTTNMQ